MIRNPSTSVPTGVCFAESTAPNSTEETDPERAEKLVRSLVKHIYYRGALDPEIRRIVDHWDIEAYIDDNDSKWQVSNRELWSRYKLRMLPRGRIYAVHYPDLLEEAILIFRALYHAPSFRDLIGIVYWAFTHLNQYQLNYAFYVTLIHSPITKRVAVPQPFQIGAEYFFNTDVMHEVHHYKMGRIYEEDGTETDQVKIVDGNYTNWYIKETSDNEHELTYFTEDIGLNTWYCYFNVIFPFWMRSEEFPDMLTEYRGQIYHYTHKLILNRYRMERLSNGLDEMDPVDWEKEIAVGYSPYMTYLNGMHFPRRPERARVPVWKNEELQRLRDFEFRINQVIGSGFMMTEDGTLENIRTKDGFNKFANLVQGNGDSLNKNYYGSVDFLARRVVGFSPKPQNRYQVLPSALENSTTSLRDPAFYRLLEKIDNYFFRYMKNLGPWPKSELVFDGVRIESVDIVEKELITYFEKVDTLIETLTYVDRKNVTRTTKIKVRQNRLNHRPFTYNLNINSEKKVKASVRIFLGPKYNVYGKEIDDNYENFFQLDYFVIDLKKGRNTMSRKSIDAIWFAPDYASIKDEEIDLYKRPFGIPERLALPRGKAEGMPVQFFFYVREYLEGTSRKSKTFIKDFDNKPLGFPLDRPIFDFGLPNMHFLDTLIYHKEALHLNLTNQ